RTMNNLGKWSDKMSSIAIIINPPFWQTWWFRAISILVFLGGIVAIFKIRMRAIKKQKEFLERVVKERTEKLERLTQEEKKARLEAESSKEEAEKERRNAESANIEAEKANQAK